MNQNDVENKNCASTQTLQTHRNQLIEIQVLLERYCNVISVFGFDSEKYDLNLITCCLQSILVNERDSEPAVLKTANQCISFKFADFRILRTFQAEQQALFHS